MRDRLSRPPDDGHDEIGRDAAERLLRGGSGDVPDEAAVAALLRAAAGPALPQELVAEHAAVAAFTEAFRTRSAAGGGRPRSGKRLAAATAAALAGLLIGGTAYAAGTGRLPDALQATIDHLLPGANAPSPAGSAATRESRSAADPATAFPAPPSGPADPAQLAAFCRSWLAFQTDPNAGPVTADVRRALAQAAGSERAIDAYCHRLLDPPAATTATTVKPGNPAPGGGKPSHPPKPTHK
ncbi:hypothetical protein Dvina_17260 [Dactylosporangium vinaceum]|uniref:DUF5667 domain-containing protein n=1 Tax=Dactylosporangium vinaceum TaxID=53362 RepID=A0ABV5MK61_9ACTN|nr:hypothetical protein [Dactylosporangium vinaceum]UAB99660.1 hypothetical protein Dvina_17260 [Dactylosporangium vinaceum]